VIDDESDKGVDITMSDDVVGKVRNSLVGSNYKTCYVLNSKCLEFRLLICITVHRPVLVSTIHVTDDRFTSDPGFDFVQQNTTIIAVCQSE